MEAASQFVQLFHLVEVEFMMVK